MGRIRGKRNRDSDRFWHERRKATQNGMVGALPVGEPERGAREVECIPHARVVDFDFKAEKKAILNAVAMALARRERKLPRLIKKSASQDKPDTSRIGWHGPASPMAEHVFAHYLFIGSAYPVFDYRDLDRERAAYIPPRLTVDYSQVYDDRAFSPAGEFGRLTGGFRGSTAKNISNFNIARDRGGGVASCAIDHFGSHRRWQERIGENASNVKLTERAVVEIRRRYAAGGVSQAKLAKEYGVSQPTIGGIVNGSLWIYAPGPVKYRLVMRARCTQEARYNSYGERTYAEVHPKPEILTEAERATLNALEADRESNRYVSTSEVKSWHGKQPVRYENGTFYPTENRFVLDVDDD